MAASRPAIQHLTQADLQGTELAAAGVGIDDDRDPKRIDDGCQSRFVLARDDYDEIGGKFERVDCRGQECSLRDCVSGRPGKQGFVGPHARGLARGKNDAAKT